MPNNVFEGLDEILARQKQAEERSRQEHEEILEAINKVNVKAAQADQVQRTVNQRNQSWSLKNFINRSVHEYIWMGSTENFNMEKQRLVTLICVSIAYMIICTIVATAAFGMYSTFTVFENIWLLLTLKMLKYTRKTKKIYLAADYVLNSIENFDLDADGVFRQKGYKARYVFFLVLAVIAFLLNTLCVWIIDGSRVPLLVTILEIAALVLSILTYVKVKDFFLTYISIRFTGLNDSGTNNVSLVFDPLMNQLYIEEDFYKKYSFAK